MSGDVAQGDPRRVLKLSVASPLLGIPISTLRRLCAQRQVPAVKVGRFWVLNRSYVDDPTSWAPDAPGRAA